MTDYRYACFDGGQQVQVTSLTDSDDDWRNMYLVQLAFYDRRTVEEARLEEPDVPQLGGIHNQQDTNSPIVRTPITVSDDSRHSLGQAPSERDIEEVDDEVFWAEWLEELQSETELGQPSREDDLEDEDGEHDIEDEQ